MCVRCIRSLCVSSYQSVSAALSVRVVIIIVQVAVVSKIAHMQPASQLTVLCTLFLEPLYF